MVCMVEKSKMMMSDRLVKYYFPDNEEKPSWDCLGWNRTQFTRVSQYIQPGKIVLIENDPDQVVADRKPVDRKQAYFILQNLSERIRNSNNLLSYITATELSCLDSAINLMKANAKLDQENITDSGE